MSVKVGSSNAYFDVLGVKIPRSEVEKYIVQISHKNKDGSYDKKEYMTVAGKVKMFMKFLSEKGLLYQMDEDIIDEPNRVRITTNIIVYKLADDGSRNDLYKFSGSAAEYRDERGNFINRAYAVENAETSALGRALGLGLGIGTELGSIESAERMSMALSKNAPASPKQKTFIKQAIAHFDDQKRSLLKIVLQENFNVKSIEELDIDSLDKSTASEVIDALMDIRKGR